MQLFEHSYNEFQLLISISTDFLCVLLKMADDVKGAERVAEWETVALVVDRCCLLVFSFCFIVATIVIFTRLP